MLFRTSSYYPYMHSTKTLLSCAYVCVVCMCVSPYYNINPITWQVCLNKWIRKCTPSITHFVLKRITSPFNRHLLNYFICDGCVHFKAEIAWSVVIVSQKLSKYFLSAVKMNFVCFDSSGLWALVCLCHLVDRVEESRVPRCEWSGGSKYIDVIKEDNLMSNDWVQMATHKYIWGVFNSLSSNLCNISCPCTV